MSCRRVRDWLHRDVESLDEAQRLILDDHLAACERCRGARHHLRLLHRAATGLSVPAPGSREYTRAIARALLEDTGRPRAAAPSPRRFGPAALAAVALVAAALAIVVLVDRVPDRAPALREAALPAPPSIPPSPRAPLPASPVAPLPASPPAPAPTAPPPIAPVPPRGPPAVADAGSAGAAVVEQGMLIDQGRTLARGAEVPANALLRATRPTRARLASLRVVIAASSELSWRPAERTVVLERGTLDLDTVAPGAARVVTERFEVEIEDAALTVDPTAVRVARGVARIVDRSRRPLARVAAGAAWRPSPDSGTLGRRPAQPSSGASGSDLLAQARSQLASGDHAGAERAVAALLASAPGESDEAEARMFLAEVAHASGALELAVERYLTVANRFGHLPAGESALYAAARIELRRSRAAAARALLTRYLARYPAGRYADDARRELATSP